jgi:hypothetical protein
MALLTQALSINSFDAELGRLGTLNLDLSDRLTKGARR